ncbi:MAG: sulfotransferase domain-containing protein [Gallionellaceae bacterium]
MSSDYDQNVISERYSQPFKSVARAISLFSVEGKSGNRRVRNAATAWFRLFCHPFSRFCILPDVLLIGASKCGTSSMAKHLSAHPGCMPPFFKEVRYFDSSGISAARFDVYKAHFPTSARRKVKEFISGKRAWTADFSPTYYDHPHAPRRVFETLGPDVKLIMMVRNPVDRAYSQFRFQRGLGIEPIEIFERALDVEKSRVAGEGAKQLANACYFSRPLNYFGYLARSLYLPSIKKWHQYFDPSQLHIVRLEDFKKSPQLVFDEVCDFIGVPHCLIKNEVHNVSKIKEQMSAETRAKLVNYFRAHNRELSDYLGRDFDWDR